MPVHVNTVTGAPCWIELFTSDPDRSQAFYRDLFGWTAESAGPEFGGYVNFAKAGHRVAGSMHNDGSQAVPDLWSVYLCVDDADATVAKAAAAGAAVVVPAMQVMQLGSMAVVAGPDNGTIGIWQPGQHTGFGLIGEPGAPTWFELHTRQYEASVAFYREVFGWSTHTMSDTPEFRYTTLGEGESQMAGIMDASAFLPDGMPSQWSIYFGVSDTDAAVEDLVRLGGAVAQPAEDTPYGRIATVTDPTGAMFRLVSIS